MTTRLFTFMGGAFAAIAIPRSYFAYFGQEHRELALAVLALLSWAIPVALLVAGGLLALHRLLPRREARALKPALAGMLMSFGYWALVSVGYFSSPEQPDANLSQAAKIAFSFPWWAAPNFFAPWLGFALAIWLSLRTSRPAPPSEA